MQVAMCPAGTSRLERPTPRRIEPRRPKPVALLLAASTLLAACASPPPPLGEHTLIGRISVRIGSGDAIESSAENRSFSAGFELAGQAEAGQLRLVSPLGSIVALATWAPGSATLQTASGSQSFAGIEDLSRAALREDLPLGAMFSWLNGQPQRTEPSTPLAPPDRGFIQAGWRIDLSAYDHGALVISREQPRAVRVNIRLDPPAR